MLTKRIQNFDKWREEQKVKTEKFIKNLHEAYKRTKAHSIHFGPGTLVETENEKEIEMENNIKITGESDGAIDLSRLTLILDKVILNGNLERVSSRKMDYDEKATEIKALNKELTILSEEAELFKNHPYYTEYLNTLITNRREVLEKLK